MISVKELKERVSYNPDTGQFTRLVAAQKSLVGSKAGWEYKGYTYLRVKGRAYKAHRLAFYYMEGYWPEYIDHQNGIRNDNRWENIRSVSMSDNNKNKRVFKSNRSGVHGVRFKKATNRWEVYIGTNPRFYLGSSKDWFEAVCMRKSGEISHGYHRNHGK